MLAFFCVDPSLCFGEVLTVTGDGDDVGWAGEHGAGLSLLGGFRALLDYHNGLSLVGMVVADICRSSSRSHV